MDDLANEIGAYPSFRRLFWKSPRLALRSLLDPVHPTAYRIFGIGNVRDIIHKIYSIK
jgi:hypothetical protein